MSKNVNNAAVMIDNDQNLGGADGIRANKELIATLNEAEAFEALKGVMAGPRSIVKRAVSGTDDLWQKVIQNFRKGVLTDNKTLAGIEVNGRNVLYKQLSRAYEMGLLLVEPYKLTEAVDDDRVTYPELAMLLYHHNMHDENEKLEKGKVSNIWIYVTKLLYGNWIATENLPDTSKVKLAKRLKVDSGKLHRFENNPDGKFAKPTIFHVWQHDRSAEKYANVFRYLHAKNVAPADVPAFIEAFSHKDFGSKLLGIERNDRFDNQKSTNSEPKKRSEKQIQERNKYIARGESFGNDDVFEMQKPKALSDNVEYGRAVFKIVGDNMVIVGFDTWEKPAYEQHVIARGKAMIAEENKIIEQQKELEDKQYQSALTINSDFTNALFDGDSNLATQLLDAGVKPSEVAEKLIGAMKDMLVVQSNTANLEQFADRVSD